MGVLLISRLEASRFSTFIILIPVFGLLGCCMCGIFCGICALSSLDTEGLSEEQKNPVPTTSDDIESHQQHKEELEAELSNLNNYQKSDASVPTPAFIIPEPTSSTSNNNNNIVVVTNDADVESNNVAVEVTHIDADID